MNKQNYFFGHVFKLWSHFQFNRNYFKGNKKYTKDDKWFIKDWSYPTGRQYVGDL